MTVFVEEFRGDAYLVVPIHGIAVEGIIEEIIGILKSCQYSCVEDGGEVERTNFSVAEGQPKDIPRYRSGVCDTEELLVHYSSGGILSRVCSCFDFSANLAVGSAGSPWFQDFGSQEVFEREDGHIIREGEELSVEDDPPLALFRSQVLNIWKQRQRESDGSSIGEEDLHFFSRKGFLHLARYFSEMLFDKGSDSVRCFPRKIRICNFYVWRSVLFHPFIASESENPCN